MMFLLILFFPIIEIYVLIQIGARIGFINTVFALIAAGILGAGFAKAQGRYLFGNLQKTLARGEIPTKQLLHALLVFIGGILFLIPGFVSDFVGLILVLPGTRHLVALYMRARFAKKLSNGQFKVFQGGFQAGFGGFDPFGQMRNRPSAGERDVTPPSLDASSEIIDVTPDSSSTDRTPKE